MRNPANAVDAQKYIYALQATNDSAAIRRICDTKSSRNASAIAITESATPCRSISTETTVSNLLGSLCGL